MRYLLFFIFFSLGVLLLFSIFVGSETPIPEYPITPASEPEQKSRAGKFVIVVRTAENNKDIDWFNAHSDMPAFWEKLGEKELEVWVLSEEQKHNLYKRPEFAITAGIEYGYLLWGEMTETFQDEFIDGKYKAFTITRAWDEYGLLADFGILPPILNVPYQWHTDMKRIYAIHVSWWTATFPLEDIVFQGENFWEKYNSIPDDLNRSKYFKAFKDSFSLAYGYGATKRDPIIHCYMAGHGTVITDLVVSIACDRQQAVNLQIDGHLPEPRVSFMVRDVDDFLVFSPGDPDGATFTVNALHIGSTFTPKDNGWSVEIRTRKKLSASDIHVSDNCKIKNFKSYPHIGGIFEATFDIVAEFNSASINYPGLKNPIILIGDQVIRR